MPCSSCAECNLVPANFGTLTIGTVGASDTAHYVYLKNLSTGRERRYAKSSSGTTLALVRTTDEVDVIAGEWYELRATLASATDIETNVNITISGTAYTCLLVKFVDMYSDEDSQAAYTAISLKV